MSEKPLAIAEKYIEARESDLLFETSAGKETKSSSVNEVLNLFRSVDAMRDLTDDERLQKVLYLIHFFPTLSFAQRSNMPQQFEHIRKKIFDVRYENGRFYCGNSELKQFGFRELFAFWGWFERLWKYKSGQRSKSQNPSQGGAFHRGQGSHRPYGEPRSGGNKQRNDYSSGSFFNRPLAGLGKMMEKK